MYNWNGHHAGLLLFEHQLCSWLLMPLNNLQVLIEDAEFLMNRASAGEVSWDEIKPQLADKYQQAGLPDVAEFVLQ